MKIETQVADTDWRRPTRMDALWFWARSRVCIARQSTRDLLAPRARRWSSTGELANARIVASSRTPLWPEAGEDEFVLTAGKVQNLRVAARSFDGVVIPPGECLSFWRQLGRPARRRGFVPGREVREGCVVPTIAGGICQLSNALAACAVRAGFELVERHAHSANVERSDGAADATVFWNYVDLKIRAPMEWRVEVALTATELVVAFRAAAEARTFGAEAAPDAMSETGRTSRSPRTCGSCNEPACFRHGSVGRLAGAREAWLLDAWTPELARELGGRDSPSLALAPTSFRRERTSNGWNSLAGTVEQAGWTSLRRSLWLRANASRGGRRQASIVDGQRWLAETYARRLRPEHTRLVVDQALLAHLHRLGALGGRRYEVLATALPMAEIERRLDLAAADGIHPGPARETLCDFRIDAALARAELEAFALAQAITTPHAGVATYFRARNATVNRLAWIVPSMRKRGHALAPGAPLVVFPASALARKGAYVLANALRGYSCRLRVLGSRSDDAALWSGIDVEYAGYGSDWLSQAAVVALPAYVEHNPRAALLAVAAGVPVVATPACGLQGLAGVTSVEAGDVRSLRDALGDVLASGQARGDVRSGTMAISCRSV